MADNIKAVEKLVDLLNQLTPIQQDIALAYVSGMARATHVGQ